MAQYARVIEQDGIPTVAEIVDFDPAARFTKKIAALFTPVEDGMVYRARKVDGEWIAPPEPEPRPEPEPAPEPEPEPVNISVPQFKMRMTAQERVAIREAAETSPYIADWLALLDDPRLEYVVLGDPQLAQAMQLLVSEDVMTQDRVDEILTS